MPTSDFVEWWDQYANEAERLLKMSNEWVADDPRWQARAAVRVTSITSKIGLFVLSEAMDVLRIGEGTAEGTVGGIGQDVLRALVFLGPAAKAGGAALKMSSASSMQLAHQIMGVDGPCTFQAFNNASKILNDRNLFLTLGDMGRALGLSPARILNLSKNEKGQYILSAWIDDLLPTVRKITGLNVKEINGLGTIDEVVDLARKSDGVVAFSFKGSVKLEDGKIKIIEHTVIATQRGGKVRFGDYGRKLHSSLDELLSQWGTVVESPRLLQKEVSAAILENAGGNVGGNAGGFWAEKAYGTVLIIKGLTMIETRENGVELALPVRMIEKDAPPSHRVHGSQPGPLGTNLRVHD